MESSMPSPLKRGGSPIFHESSKVSRSDLSSDESDSDYDHDITVTEASNEVNSVWQVQSNHRLRKKPAKSQQNVHESSVSPDLFPIILEDVGNESDPKYRSYGQFTTGLFKSIEINDVSHQKRISPTKWLIYLKSRSSQSKLESTTVLGGIKVSCTVPQRCAVGVVKPVPFGIPITQIKAACPEIKDAFRLKRKNGEESNAIKIVFNSGDLPASLKVGNEYMHVDVYVDPVLRCSQCQKIGHKKSSCRSKLVLCPRCGKSSHDASNPENNIKLCKESNNEMYCVNCKVKGHSSAWKGCPSIKIQKRVNAESAKSGVPRGIVKHELKVNVNETERSSFDKNIESSSVPVAGPSSRQVNKTLSFANAVKGQFHNTNNHDSSDDQGLQNNLINSMSSMLQSFEKKIDDKFRSFEEKLKACQEKKKEQLHKLHDNFIKSSQQNPVKHLIINVVKNIVLAAEGNTEPLVHIIKSFLPQQNNSEIIKAFKWDSELSEFLHLAMGLPSFNVS